jgi:protein-S-isoprenylcysteine O-methyltransferase Ste14
MFHIESWILPTFLIDNSQLLVILKGKSLNKLNTKAWLGLIFVTAVMGLLLFVPEGTVQYWQAWTYLGIYFGASFLITLYLVKKDPALLKRRLSGGPTAEKEKSQKIIMLLTTIGFFALLVVSALDYRFMWSCVPLYAVIGGDILTALWFYIIFLVFKENTFSSATIEITEHQRVISTGPYAIVRHPMYAGGLLLFIGTPLALGSYWGLIAFITVLPALIWRLSAEEMFLAKNLPGYVEYCAKVHWRLVPGIF